MLELIYEWNQEEYSWLLFELKDGEKYFIDKFDDREDLLIYLEEKYTLAKLIIRGK